jgi:hypothetical protein
MPVKFYPEIEGLEHCFVAINEQWTRKEVMELQRNRAGEVRADLLLLQRELDANSEDETLLAEMTARLHDIEARMAAAQTEDGETLIRFLRAKVVTCCLDRPGQEPLTDPLTLSEETFEELDIRLLGFLGSVLMLAIRHLESLGPLAGRLSSPGSDGSNPKTASQTKKR